MPARFSVHVISGTGAGSLRARHLCRRQPVGNMDGYFVHPEPFRRQQARVVDKHGQFATAAIGYT